MINLPNKTRRIADQRTLSELDEWHRKHNQRKLDAIGVDQLTKKLGVSKRTFQRWEAKGDAPRSYLQDGMNIYIPSDVRSWLIEIVKSQTDPATFAKLIPHITEDMPLELLKQKRAAEMIGVSPRTLSRRAGAGSGPVSVRIGQGVYYPRAFLEIWRDQNPKQNGGVK